jgi:hypothetical protein
VWGGGGLWFFFSPPRRRAVDIKRARIERDVTHIEMQAIAFDRPYMPFADDVLDLTQQRYLSDGNRSIVHHAGSHLRIDAEHGAPGFKPEK